MRKLLAWLFSFALLLGICGTVDAGKGGGSSSGGSRSSSSGSSSRSSSSSGSKSYSAPARSSSSSPSSSGTKSYSAPASRSTTTSPSTSGPVSKPATPSAPATRPPSGSGYSSSSGRSYSAPAARTTPPTSPGGSVSSKPTTARYDKLPAEEKRKAESRAAYEKAQAPKASYTTAAGKSATIDPRDRQVDQLRHELSYQRWVNREQRLHTFYGPYYGRPLVIYNDLYSSVFWWWLLDLSFENRALWAYHHRYSMDQARYDSLLARDAQLVARIRQLEQMNLQRDPAYVPPGVERDLMYADDYVDAVYNPQPVATAAPPPSPPLVLPPPSPRHQVSSGISALFTWVLTLISIVCIFWLVIWLVFVKRWNF